MQVSLLLCFLSRRLLRKDHGISVAGALVTINITVVDPEELGRSIRGHGRYCGVVLVVVCDLWFML